ncbi:glycoside hydrolase family 57 protein [Geomesophilobacter sediminis]|uniref:Glycoside hydrolase n=1 Tax=Geomesophilobacter sediminis TaxID=2798584 RepID=A0A8J7S9V0_9BACT|nr:glycoside hydrolase family 57 protein [Geomesophilobacter sediminis]MBJ6727071.1 glycoside hydrolase [Geomesophilobacter sediminis]
MAEPLYVSFLWHMHQPYYKDPVEGEYLLPWTYLHGIKDYYDMPAIVEATEGARATFNLVPSLLEQLLEYASGTASDPFLTLAARPPADLDDEERLFILENFFSANRQRMIEPHPRYLELYCLAGGGSGVPLKDRLHTLRPQDFLDLQVWFFLTWTGEMARRRFPVFAELIAKGKNYTEQDKALLLATQRTLLGEIVPLYRRLAEEGKVELSVTPYFHPILPLLCDTGAARTALPKINLPMFPFRHPEDARAQISRAIALFQELFGVKPKGMWPSEGSVSDEALCLMAECGIGWAASDEWVLAHSLAGGIGKERDHLYRPYQFQRDGHELALFFRDHALSDAISFTYSQWETQRAAADFLGRLKEILRHCHAPRVASIIMDGENAWEYFEGNGLPFLSRVYSALSETHGLVPATFSEALERIPERRPLHHIHPGSWINANYAIWIGHPEENTAWDHLARARQAAVAASPEVARILAGGDDGDETAQLVCTSLYAAEGSDWFWWYGDDHFSHHAGTFDLLFRRHLMNVYRLLDLEVPRELFAPIKKLLPAGFIREPAALITPALTGTVTDYFKWLAAGLYDLSKRSSTMHAGESLLQSLYYGFDLEFFYFRIDGVQPLDRILGAADVFTLNLIAGLEFRADLVGGAMSAELLQKEDGVWRPSGAKVRYCVVRVAEVAVPLAVLGLAPGDRLFAQFTLSRAGELLGRWPLDAPLLLDYAGPELEAETWLI